MESVDSFIVWAACRIVVQGVGSMIEKLETYEVSNFALKRSSSPNSNRQDQVRMLIRV